ncbi:MAG: AAA family ATPase [Candidatus Helarchaeota archaeon]
MIDAFNYYKPAGSFFVDRQRELQLFKDILETKKKSIFIHGRPGIGKTSLVEQCMKSAVTIGYMTLSYDVPLINSEAFFDLLIPDVLNIFKQKKSTGKPPKLGKNCPLIKRSYEIQDEETYTKNFILKFNKKIIKMRKLLQKQGKKGIVIFVDRVERFIFLANEVAFDIFNKITQAFEETTPKIPDPLPIYFVLVGDDRYAPKIKFSLSNFETLGIPKITAAVANEMLNKREIQAAVNISEEVRKKIFESSQGIPELILYNTNMLCEKTGKREIGLTEWNEVEAQVKEGFAQELEGLSDETRALLQAFAMEPVNFADVDMLVRATGIERETVLSTLNELAEKHLIQNEGENYYFSSSAFWEFLRNSMGDIAISAQARSLVTIAEHDAENGRIVDTNLFNELEKLRKDSITAGLVTPIETIARGYERVGIFYLQTYDYFAEAFKYITIAADSFVKVNELEKSAAILEDAVKVFKEKEQGDYARDMLIKAVEAYEMLENADKIKELKLQIAENSESKALSSIDSGDYALARANFTRAERTYIDIGETGKSLAVLEKAKQLFFDKKEYFYSWQFTARMIEEYMKAGDMNKAKSLLDDAVAKFSDTDQPAFGEKLTDQFAKKIQVSG